MIVRHTDAAAAAVRRVRDAGRADLVMVLSNGCCDSTAPYLFDAYLAEPTAAPVGEIEGVPILAPAWLRRLYPEQEDVTVDVVGGALDDSMSLETDLGLRFVLRAPGNAGLG